MVSKFNIYTVHLKCFDSIRYNLNQYKTLTKNFNRTRTYVHTYIHTDTVKAICPHGDYRPRGHKNKCHHHQIGMDYLYDAIFKMAANEVKLCFHLLLRI